MELRALLQRDPADRWSRLAGGTVATGWFYALGAVVVALLLVAGIAAAVLGASATYRAQATLLIDQPAAIAAVPSPAVFDKLSKLRLKYAGLVTTQEFSAPIGRRAGLGEEVVADALFADVQVGTLLMTVGARAPQPQRAERIAATAAGFLVDYVQREQEAAGIPPEQRFTFEVVTPVEQAVRISNATRRVALVTIATGALLALGLLTAWLRYR